MSSFTVVICNFFYFLANSDNLYVWIFFHLSNFVCYFPKHLLQHSSFFIFSSFSSISFKFYHICDFFIHYFLLSFKSIKFTSHLFKHFIHLHSHTYFKLSPSQFFLFHPWIYCLDLCLKIVLDSYNCLVFSLELSSYNGIHSLVPISHFFSFIFLLFIDKLLFCFYLLSNVFIVLHSWILLHQQSLHNLGHSHFKFIRNLSLHLSHMNSEIIIIDF